MDVCTLIVQLFINDNLIACVAKPECVIYEDRQLKVCTPMCPPPQPQYDCVRPDGSHYIRNRDELNLPKG